ncbi:TonB-dependent receptor [Mucilaginibacter sp. KACC 22063]|uniref:TonB-dependent receptor n=1 Tax=Mucilaginibacter sp. KACC 22063 TaxID=3025666 RepID=UPI002366AE6B|nr:TonB-dependent receptor [Mucilaginibacter sp. KACC 22063]WDF54425.1 TonB-dependent receptor [Mucilaginibacter sp. KACC 22063]
MKITLSQVLVTAMISGVTYASPLKAQNILDKKVDLSVESISVQDVLNYLQKADNVKFIYSANTIDVTKKVSVNFKDQPLKKVLDNVLTNNGIDYTVLKDRIILGKKGAATATESNGNTIDLTAEGSATNNAVIPVSGKIVDETGQPVIGATVVEKGTTNGVSVGVDGSYKLNVNSTNSVLVVSFLGYASQEIPVGSQTVINVTLRADNKTLNEVVVVGYGTQKRTTVTGAISSVKASDLENQQITRVDDALKGRTPGVNVVQSSGAPGAAPTVRVRGITSINNSDPLYVIDGVIVTNGGIDNINPNDIESMDVLKDASAAIYGSRASNGVILITTKKGKTGPAKISYNGYTGWQSPVKKVDLANATQYATLRNQAVTNDGGTAPFANPAQYGTGTNWQDVIFANNAFIQNHNLSISGANDNASYYTSFGYLDQDGIVLPQISNYKRFNFTTNTSFKLKKWLTVGENFTYTYTRNQGIGNTNSVFGGPLSSALNLDPLTPTVVTDINAQPNASVYTSNAKYILRNALGQPYGISNYVQNEITNPLAYAQNQAGNFGYSHNLLGSAFVEVTPIAGLKIRSQISGKEAFYGSKSFTPLYYLNGSSSNLSATSQYLDSESNLTWNLDNTASYTRSFGLHNVSALVGFSAQRQSGFGLNGTFLGEPVNTFNEASPNFALVNANKIANGYDNQPYSLASTFARITYDYDQKYLFTGIIRRDGSSKFGSNNVYGTFPSGEIGYVMTREDWFPKNTFIDFLKIRGSYGVVGNEMSLNPFQYLSTIGSGRNYVFGNPNTLYVGYSPNAPSNPDLKWEETHTADIGLDLTLFNNLSVNLDVYQKKTKGMLQQVQLPAYAGFAGQPSANIGDMENKGIEVSLSYNNRIGDFKYNVGGNLAYNHNEVTYLGTQINYFTVGNVQSTAYEIGRTQVGHPVGAFYGFQEVGTFKSQAEINSYTNASGALIQPNAKPGDFKWVDTNGDGKIDANDRTWLGNPLPTFTYGVNLSGSYKQFDFLLFGQGAWGNKIYQAYRRLDLNTANYPLAALNAWSPSNASSNYPRLSDADPNNNFKNPSNFYLQSGAYFRIKTLQVGYTIPKNWLKAADIQKVRVFLSSNNLLTITGYKGFDPEIGANSNGSVGIGGIDMGVYPQARTLMVGLDITL